MRFCENCNNMYYIKLSESNADLVYYCRKCGQEDNTTDTYTVVSKTTLSKDQVVNSNIINPYTKLDPTIPHVSNIPCPNNDCPCNQEDSLIKKDVLYIRYNDQSLNYIFMCTHCDTTWTNNLNN
jgi:DNA-directed RNA polymerase subunit M/transcription elongation factor TFIIS